MPSTLKACLFKLSPESLAQLEALSKRIGGDRCSKTETIRRLISDRFAEGPPRAKPLTEVFGAGPQELTVDISKVDAQNLEKEFRNLSVLPILAERRLERARSVDAAKEVDDLTKLCLKEPKKYRMKKARTKIAKVEVAVHGPRSEEPALCLNGDPEYPMEPKTASTRSLVRTESHAVNKPGGKIL